MAGIGTRVPGGALRIAYALLTRILTQPEAMDTQGNSYAAQQRLVESLSDPSHYDPAPARVERLETHISHVLLAGDYAYKIKKPLNLGFLDFSTLERRRHFCEEELRLNRRTAPELYLEVVPIGGTPEAPRLGDAAAPIEYAVRMRRFPEAARLDHLLDRGELTPATVDAVARQLAAFHAELPAVGKGSEFGDPAKVRAPVVENFRQIAALPHPAVAAPLLAQLRDWSEQTWQRLSPLLAARKRDGFVRECHGDAHLGNMVLLDGEVVLFDCIEFNPSLRWIDVISEAAFPAMDLASRGHPPLAARFLDGYLAATGDYAGAALLPYYLCYRAMVRAKVAAIRLAQSGLEAAERSVLEAEFGGHVALATRYTQPARPRLLITHGVSGSGKSSGCQPLLESLPALRVRSDLERKRLFGLAPGAPSHSDLAAGIYSEEASARTYARLLELTRGLIDAGLSVIVDATFLQREQRRPFVEFAAAHGTPFAILDFDAPPSVLRARIEARSREGRDPSEADLAVLERQLATREPLDARELSHTITMDTRTTEGLGRLAEALARLQPPA